MREGFIEAWRKQREGRPLTPLEGQIAALVAEHPEYHALLESSDAAHRDSFEGAENPFLHLAMHLALREQSDTDRPPGVRAALARLAEKTGSRHAAEHAAMACLHEALSNPGADPDGARYVASLAAM